MASVSKAKRPGKNRPTTRPVFVKMYQSEDLKTSTIEVKVKSAIDSKSTVKTDGYRGYSKLKNIFRKHHRKVIPAKEAHIQLPWVHTMIGNFKRFVNGVPHHVSDDYLQYYPDEFVYKVNRRYFGSKLLERVVFAGISIKWDDYG